MRYVSHLYEKSGQALKLGVTGSLLRGVLVSRAKHHLKILKDSIKDSTVSFSWSQDIIHPEPGSP